MLCAGGLDFSATMHLFFFFFLLFSLWLFYLFCGGTVHLVYRFFSEGNDPYVAVDLSLVEGTFLCWHPKRNNFDTEAACIMD